MEDLRLGQLDPCRLNALTGIQCIRRLTMLK